MITWSTWAREPAELPSWYPPSKAPSTLHGSLGAQDRGQGDQERQVGGGAFPDSRSRRGEEGICPAHSSSGRLLGSQVRSPAL